jgi:hypothetical protein
MTRQLATLALALSLATPLVVGSPAMAGSWYILRDSTHTCVLAGVMGPNFASPAALYAMLRAKGVINRALQYRQHSDGNELVQVDFTAPGQSSEGISFYTSLPDCQAQAANLTNFGDLN